MQLHALTQAARSYALLVYDGTKLAHWFCARAEKYNFVILAI